MLATIIGIGSYKWYYRFGFAHVPNINMTTLREGQTLNLAKLQGKPILLTFWSSNCPTCLSEIPHLEDLDLELSQKGLQIVGVSVYWDKLNRLRDLVQSEQLPYPVVYDGDRKMFHAIGGYGETPTTYLINSQGRVVMKKIGKINMPAVRKTILAMLEKN
ncbi:MAG: TlpA disulfide reductase family protein [Gammaproteobacteria bacterium]